MSSCFFFSSRRRHTRYWRDWSSDVCSSDLGLFLAPHISMEALKGAILCARIMELAGFEVLPKYDEKRSDIIQAIKFNDKDKLIEFCKGIQTGSPIDSFVSCEPWDMPGYTDQVIMAAGAFIQGSSIELSADAPIREPYIAYRSEERRVGKECRSRWSPYHYKKKVNPARHSQV